MNSEAFWAMYRPFYQVLAWLYSLAFGALGLFFLLCGFWTPMLFAIAPFFFASGAAINPWIVKRWRRRRAR